MNTVVRHVRDLNAAERSTIERVIGCALHDSQDVVIQVTDGSPPANASAGLPDWCGVYQGLTDQQIAGLEQTILQRADLSRST